MLYLKAIAPEGAIYSGCGAKCSPMCSGESVVKKLGRRLSTSPDLVMVCITKGMMTMGCPLKPGQNTYISLSQFLVSKLWLKSFL